MKSCKSRREVKIAPAISWPGRILPGSSSAWDGTTSIYGIAYASSSPHAVSLVSIHDRSDSIMFQKVGELGLVAIDLGIGGVPAAVEPLQSFKIGRQPSKPSSGRE